MVQMSGNDKSSSIGFGDNSKLTNWILDSGARSHMTPQVPYFIPGLLEDTDKYIDVSDWHDVTAKPKGQILIQMCDDNRYPFIATLHNLILAPDLWNGFFNYYVN